MGGDQALFLDGRGVQEERQNVVEDESRVGTPGRTGGQRRDKVVVEGLLEAGVFCFADKEEKEEGFEKTDEKNVEGETEDAAVPALAGRVGLS